MEFLLSHWHCILPVMGLIVAAVLMREKPRQSDEPEER